MQRVIIVGVLAWAGAMLTLGCRPAPPPPPASPPYHPLADVKQLMASVLDPAADVVWGSVGTIVSAAGTEERAPKTDEEWNAVLGAAWTITESGNLLMMGKRPKDNEDWMTLSRELVDVGHRAVKAAESRNKDAIFDVGGEIYAVCTNCHQKYDVRIAEEPEKP